MRKEVRVNVRALVALAVTAAALTATATADAILGGGLDNGRHPSVGALLVPGANGLEPECSGVLVAPRVFLTAAHCTEFALSTGGAYVAFGDTLDPSQWQPIHGTPVSDPAYGHDAADLQDLGVVLLDRPPPVAPAVLPAPGAGDGLHGSAVVAVGYGYSQRDGNKSFVYDGARHAASLDVASETATTLRLSSHDGVALCFGDSGGPQYLGDSTTVVSVTSGGNSVCGGNATAMRLDSASARAFLSRYIQLPG
jgi:secreted trypsin-like serine protease